MRNPKLAHILVYIAENKNRLFHVFFRLRIKDVKSFFQLRMQKLPCITFKKGMTGVLVSDQLFC